jgi:hypothetical protein
MGKIVPKSSLSFFSITIDTRSERPKSCKKKKREKKRNASLRWPRVHLWSGNSGNNLGDYWLGPHDMLHQASSTGWHTLVEDQVNNLHLLVFTIIYVEIYEISGWWRGLAWFVNHEKHETRIMTIMYLHCTFVVQLIRTPLLKVDSRRKLGVWQ